MIKHKLVSTVRIIKNTVTTSNLSKQKVAPDLDIFSAEVTAALKLEFRD